MTKPKSDFIKTLLNKRQQQQKQQCVVFYFKRCRP